MELSSQGSLREEGHFFLLLTHSFLIARTCRWPQCSARGPLSATHCRSCPLLSARANDSPPTPFLCREKHLSRRAWSASPTGSQPRSSSPSGGAPLSRGWLPRCRRSATASWTCAASLSGTPRPSRKWCSSPTTSPTGTTPGSFLCN